MKGTVFVASLSLWCLGMESSNATVSGSSQKGLSAAILYRFLAFAPLGDSIQGHQACVQVRGHRW